MLLKRSHELRKIWGLGRWVTDIEKPDVVEHACNLDSWEAKTDRFLGILVGQPS